MSEPLDILTMFGTPGKNLSRADNPLEEKNLKAGIKGEEKFAHMLAMTPLAHKYEMFFSLILPNGVSDVDCVMVNGNTITLVDLKYYRGGAVEYYPTSEGLVCVDSATRALVGEPKPMSENMSYAQQVFQDKFPSMIVSSYVVFVPTELGEPFIPNDAYWSDTVRMISASRFISLMEEISASDTDPNVSDDIRDKLLSMVSE